MPEQIQVTETYWGWCGWYPCRKRRTVTKWRYRFRWVKVQQWGLACYSTGCEPEPLGQGSSGKEYTWWEGCFGVLGTQMYYNVEKVWDQRRNPDRDCVPGI